MSTSPHPSHGGQFGFTMIELIVVMIVIGILAVVVLPRFDLLGGFDEIGYRDKVRATLEYARKLAVAQRRNVCVRTSGNSLELTIENTVPESSAGTCTAAANFPRALTLPAADHACGGATNQVCAPANVTLKQNGGATGQLAFSPLGRPFMTGMAVSPTVTYTVTGSAAYTITVEAETGYVH